jgi:hypothetical protein
MTEQPPPTESTPPTEEPTAAPEPPVTRLFAFGAEYPLDGPETAPAPTQGLKRAVLAVRAADEAEIARSLVRALRRQREAKSE